MMLPCSHYLDSVPIPAPGRAGRKGKGGKGRASGAHSPQEPWQNSLQVSGRARGPQHFRQSVGTAQFGTSWTLWGGGHHEDTTPSRHVAAPPCVKPAQLAVPMPQNHAVLRGARGHAR